MVYHVNFNSDPTFIPRNSGGAFSSPVSNDQIFQTSQDEVANQELIVKLSNTSVFERNHILHLALAEMDDSQIVNFLLFLAEEDSVDSQLLYFAESWQWVIDSNQENRARLLLLADQLLSRFKGESSRLEVIYKLIPDSLRDNS